MKTQGFKCNLCGSSTHIIGIRSFYMGDFEGYHYYFEVPPNQTDTHLCEYCLVKLKNGFEEKKLLK